MKRLILPLLILSSTAIAGESLTKSEKGEVEILLAESASKLLYLERDCDKPMDAEKFVELSKLKAFEEGYTTIEGISWDRVALKAHKGYGALKVKAPMGELCKQYREDIRGMYRFLKPIEE
jgi:hypothetical protein